MSDLHKNLLKKHQPSPPPLQQTPPTADDELIITNYKQFKQTLTSEIYIHEALSFQTYYKPGDDTSVLFCVHGAGSSSMTFAALCQQLTIGIFMYDLRGHGNSSKQVPDYQLTSLVRDTQSILDQFVQTHPEITQIYLLGHSLGGSIITNIKHSLVKGIIVLDIVEETAIKSLTIAMPQFISKLPLQFTSMSQAVDWHMNNLLNNETSAQLSVPDLLTSNLTFQVDLFKTKPYWKSWFDKLSSNFINYPGGKLLILANHETLDKSLIIGQMQGKYQLVVFNTNGHFIHEDLPMQVSVTISDFIKRSTISQQQQERIVPKWGGKVHS
ncbi:Protein phosphatase methylesterase 1 [Spathaspora sp. JA1]|nr:Protein phosphatase methylesterase 1 [Spathaspora sp. JA1]